MYISKILFNQNQLQMRNKLYKNGNQYGVGFDLSSVDIQRGRDHGLAPYYQYLELCFSVKIKTWSDLVFIVAPEVFFFFYFLDKYFYYLTNKYYYFHRAENKTTTRCIRNCLRY